MDQHKYETVVGLEVHAQLLTDSKIFSGDSTVFGGIPNTQVSPITLGHPGTLPRLNKKVVEFAVKMGLACHCGIEPESYFARKNYFYPDLPKGYQITQHTTPICTNGYITIHTAAGEKRIRIHHIHLEEDAGKSIHDQDTENTLVDYNRAGVPLIEIVSEPDIRGGEEAYAYLTEIRKLVRYLGICDGNMEEGSLRCDANISIRLKGDKTLGAKVEVKNMNSIRNVKKAIEVEAKRQVEMTENREAIVQETRSFDAGRNTTFAMRFKEMANDYRYFPEPDLVPVKITGDWLDTIRKTIPALPEERMHKYITVLGLPAYDAGVLCDDKDLSDYFEKLILHTANYKAAANWILGPVKSYLNETNGEIKAFPLPPASLAALVQLTGEGKLNFSTAVSAIFPVLIASPYKQPLDIAVSLNLILDANSGSVAPIVESVLAGLPGKVLEYKKGKKGLLALFIGEVMKQSKGKADPKVISQLLRERLDH